MWNRRGQSLAEYAVVFGVAVAAIVAMQLYVGRSFKAKIKDSTDLATGSVDTFLKAQGAKSTTAQYEPYYASSDYTVNQNQQFRETIGKDMAVNTVLTQDKTVRTGSSNIGSDQTKDDGWTAQ